MLRDLDDNTLDHPWQPGDQLLLEDRLWLYEVTAAPEDNWAKAGDKSDLADKSGRRGAEGSKVENSNSAVSDADLDGLDLRPSAGASGL